MAEKLEEELVLFPLIRKGRAMNGAPDQIT
jgi:hypothetical protein